MLVGLRAVCLCCSLPCPGIICDEAAVVAPPRPCLLVLVPCFCAAVLCCSQHMILCWPQQQFVHALCECCCITWALGAVSSRAAAVAVVAVPVCSSSWIQHTPECAACSATPLFGYSLCTSCLVYQWLLLWTGYPSPFLGLLLVVVLIE